MKNLIFFLLCCPLMLLQAQSVSSSCEASEELESFYEFDATKLAIRDLHNNQHPDTAAIAVEEAHKLPILKALLAVHQAYSLSARDEVVDFFNVHALGAPATNSFILYADTSVDWVSHWIEHDIHTGLLAIDQWVDSFDLFFSRSPEMLHLDLLDGDFLRVNMQSETGLNLRPLLDELAVVPGIVMAEEEYYTGEVEKDIWYQLEGTIAELTYRYAWENCQDSCHSEHFWTFRVDLNDCSVEFVDDGGDPLPVEDVDVISKVAIFPNPTSGPVFVDLVGPAKANFVLHLYDAYGQRIRSEALGFHNGLLHLDLDISDLPTGIYFITLSYQNQILSKRILKW